MKRIGFLITLAVIGFTLVFAQNNTTGFSISETEHDFGKIYEEDGDVSHEFTITNKGDTPLEILNVHASCGCTASEWTKTPIEPGETGIVKATYSTKNRPGMFNKSISIFTNVREAPFVVRIKGEVLRKAPANINMQVQQPELINSNKK